MSRSINIKIMILPILFAISLLFNSVTIFAQPAGEGAIYVDSNTIRRLGAEFKLIPKSDTAFYDQVYGNTNTGFQKLSEAYPELVGQFIYLDTTSDTSYKYCTNFIVLDKYTGRDVVDPSKGTYWGMKHTDRTIGRSFCERTNTIPVNIAGAGENWSEDEANSTAEGVNPENLTLEEGCAAAMPGIGWFACQIINMADGVYQFMVDRIARLLITNTDELEGLRASWTAVKNVANALLVLVALVMIASQIFSLDILSAYTVKKIIPRLLVAAILIQLSWTISILAIEAINAIGSGLHNLLLYPFIQSGGSNDIASLFSSSTGGQQSTAGLLGIFLGATGVAAVAITALQVGGWLTIVITLIGVLVAILVAFFVILIRGILILILVAMAPLAVVAWILPGTQNLWKIWYELFSKLLLMFPLIMLLFAGGAIGANLIADTIQNKDGLDAVFAVIMMLVVYFAPLFLITATFKFAGKTFGAITGGINKLNTTGKKGGYGLGARRDAYKKASLEAQGYDRQAAAREKTAKLYSGKSGRAGFRERAQHGVGGFAFGGKSKVSRQRARYADVGEQERVKEGQEVFSGIVSNSGADKDFAFRSGLGLPDIHNGLHSQILSNPIDGRAMEIKNRDGQVVSRNSSTEYVHEAALTDAINQKNLQVVDEYAERAIQNPNGPEARVLDKVAQKSFGTLDATAPDRARSGVWERRKPVLDPATGQQVVDATGNPVTTLDPSSGKGKIVEMLGSDSSASRFIQNEINTKEDRKRSKEIFGEWSNGLKQYGSLKGGRMQAMGALLDETISNGQARMAAAQSPEEKQKVLKGVQSAVANIEGLMRSESVQDSPEADELVRKLYGGKVGRVMNSGGNERFEVQSDGSVSIVSTVSQNSQNNSGPGNP